MGYFKSTEIVPNTWYIRERLGVGSYLFIGDEKALLSDTGNGFFDISKPIGKITNKPLMVMNTHGHSDHAGGNAPFRDVYMHEADVHMLDPSWQKHQRGLLWSYAKRKAPVITPLIFLTERKLAKMRYANPNPLADGHVFDLGGRKVRTRHFPGHSPGSVLLLDDDTRTIFAGDAVNQGLFLFFKGSPTLREYAERLRNLSTIEGYDWVRGSHSIEPMPFSFISYLADFLERAADENGTETDFPNDTPVIRYSEKTEGFPSPETSVFYTKIINKGE